MPESRIVPDKITKPIQLLGAWLTGLLLVNGSFLGTAAAIMTPEWLRSALVIASIVNVPIFLGCLFLLQTKFRPEMQEDAYYSKYLESNTGRIVVTSPAEAKLEKLRAELSIWESRYVQLATSLEASLKTLANERFVSEEGEVTLSSVGISNAVKKVAKSVTAVERAIERSEYWGLTIQLNDLLPEYKDIRQELARHRLIVGQTFGSASEIRRPREHARRRDSLYRRFAGLRWCGERLPPLP